MNNRFIIIFLPTFLFLSACAVKYPFNLVKTDFDIAKDNLLKERRLSIEIFEDIRNADAENELHFTKRKITNTEEGKKCINSEKNYPQPLNYQLSKQTATYIKNTLLFEKVIYGKKEITDYYITAKLKNYRAIQNFSYQAQKDAVKKVALAAGGGIVGGAVGGAIAGLAVGRPTNFESEGELLIQLDDIKLYDKEGKLIKDIGLIETNISGLFPADADCWCAYWAAEDHYPIIVEELLNNIISGILEYEGNRRDRQGVYLFK